MSDNETDPHLIRLNAAVATRLSRLGTYPVDTRALDARLRSLIGPRPMRRRISLYSHPLRALAASLSLLLIVAAALIGTAGGPVLASPNEMAALHRDLVSGKWHTMEVNSIREANVVLAAKTPGVPAIPGLATEHAMLCCLKSVKDKKVALLLIRDQGVPITLAVADANDMKLPASGSISSNGVTYHTQSLGKLQMIMTERNGKWLCLMGELTAEDLMRVAGAIEP